MSRTNILQTQIDAVNAYADYLQGDYITRDHSQFDKRNAAVVALRNAAMEALHEVQDWQEVSTRDSRDRGELLLQSPEGVQVVYTYHQGAERLRRVETAAEETTAPQAQLNAVFEAGVRCDVCEAQTASVGQGGLVQQQGGA